jgi:hypothetical protein
MVQYGMEERHRREFPSKDFEVVDRALGIAGLDFK